MEDSAMDRFGEQRIDEALELLDTAARDKRAELSAALENKYTDLASVVRSVSNQVKDRATQKIVAGKQKVVEVATCIDRSVHENSWTYIAGAAGAAMLFGFFLGRSRRD
jgi:ElaB/YqjD/DUF883 family membrane-anchored ribosome-binding protein